MGRGRSTLVLLIVLVALGAYIFFVERKREPAADGDAEPRKKVFSVEASKIEELQVKASAGDQTTLKEEGERWRLVSPVAAEADQGEVSGLTSNLASLEQQRVVEEKAADLKPYGLDAPRIAVGFRASGDKTTKRLLLGSKTPTGGDMYAKLEDAAPVFLVSGFLDSTFDRSTFDLRDKAVLKIERDKVDGLELETASPAGALRLAKTQDAWSLAAPVQARADFGAVEGLLGRVATARMKAIVEPEATDLKKYGLDAPAYTLGLSAGSARASFLVGSQTPDGQYYAKDASRPMVFTVDSILVDDLKKPAADYRMKDLFEFRTFTGTRLELTRDGTSLVFEKQKGKEKDAPEKWSQVQPKKEIEEGKILDFLSRLTNLRADTFVDALPAGATQAATVKAVSSENKKEDAVTFLKAGEDVYATRPGEPGAAKVSATEFTEAIKLLDGLK
jgi:hypothetical protein